jgi:hypothetical protein
MLRRTLAMSGALLVCLRRGDGAVARAGLHVEEDLEVLRVGAVRLGQQRHRLLVIVTKGVLAEAGAADGVSGGDAGVDAERHVGVGDVLVVDGRRDRLGRQVELGGFRHPSRLCRLGATLRATHDAAPSARGRSGR